MRRVVVTGVGVISPIGIGHAAFWENLLAGKSGVRRITSFAPATPLDATITSVAQALQASTR